MSFFQIHEYSSALPLDDTAEEPPSDEGVEEMSTSQLPKHHLMLDQVNQTVQAQQSALEILTNLFCSSENEEEWVDEDDETSDDDSLVDNDNGMETTEDNTSASLPPILLEVFKAENLIQKILARANLPAENVLDILKNNPQGVQVISTATSLRCKAFLCLNNMIEILTIEDLGGQDNLKSLWKDLGSLSITEAPSEDLSVIDASTSAMRAISQKITIECSMLELEQLAQVGAKSVDANVRVNLVHMLGNLGQKRAALEQASFSQEQVYISRFLLEAASRDVELRVVSEALDKIFDMFSEDYTNALCKEVGLVPKLKQVQPGFRTKLGLFKQQRGAKEADTLALATMVKNNLGRFIKYKEKSMK